MRVDLDTHADIYDSFAFTFALCLSEMFIGV